MISCSFQCPLTAFKLRRAGVRCQPSDRTGLSSKAMVITGHEQVFKSWAERHEQRSDRLLQLTCEVCSANKQQQCVVLQSSSVTSATQCVFNHIFDWEGGGCLQAAPFHFLSSCRVSVRSHTQCTYTAQYQCSCWCNYTQTVLNTHGKLFTISSINLSPDTSHNLMSRSHG